MADDLIVTDVVLEDPLVLRRLLSDIIERLDNDVISVTAAELQKQISEAGGITSYYADEAPKLTSLLIIGDLWFDTSDQNKPYRFNGVSWVEIRDGSIAAAQSSAAAAILAAAQAQATADGKITTFYTTTQPTAEGTGDLWVDTDDDRLYRWSGSVWTEIQDSDILQALNNAATAQNTADGKVVTFYSATSPTAEGVGDLWVDTDDQNKLYRWSGSSWVSIRDTTIADAAADATQALADAATAQGTADGKVVTFYQTTTPSGTLGDLWLDSDDGNKIYRHNGTSFIEVQDNDIAQALTNAATGIADAATAQGTADGKVTTFYSTTSPTAEGVGDLWVDTDDQNKLYRWSGSSWVSIRDTTIADAAADAVQALADAAAASVLADSKIVTFYQTTIPSGDEGDLWIDTDDSNRLYRHNGTTFITVQDGDIAAALSDAAQAISDAAGAQATADGKIVTFYQTTIPTGDEGDLWVDTDDNNKLYRHNGTTFISIQDGDISDAALTAIWGTVTGPNRPADNADVTGDNQAGSVAAEDVNSGTIDDVTLATSLTGQRIIINQTGDELEFYDVNDDLVATIGINTGEGSDNVILKLGAATVAAGGIYQCIDARTYSAAQAIFAANHNPSGGYALTAVSIAGIGILAYTLGSSQGDAGIHALCFSAGGVPFRIGNAAAGYNTPPAAVYNGSFFLQNNGDAAHLYVNDRWHRLNLSFLATPTTLKNGSATRNTWHTISTGVTDARYCYVKYLATENRDIWATASIHFRENGSLNYSNILTAYGKYSEQENISGNAVGHAGGVALIPLNSSGQFQYRVDTVQLNPTVILSAMGYL